MVRLDPPSSHHHLRTDFKIDNLDGWMTEHRGEYLAAILTLARGWINAGQPQEKARADGYARWIAGLRGLMQWAGFEGTFGGTFDAEAITEEDEEWLGWLQELHANFGAQLITIKDIVADMTPTTQGWDPNNNGWQRTTGIDPEKLPGDLSQRWVTIHDGRDMAFRKALGKWMSYRHGRFVGSPAWQLVHAGKNGTTKAEQYWIKAPASTQQAQ
jgi:hypothetical protein